MIQTCSKSSAILSLFLVLNFRWRATATRVNGLETVKKLNLHWTGLGEVFWTSDLEVWKSARWAANKVLALTYHFSSISISLLPALRLRSVSAGKRKQETSVRCSSPSCPPLLLLRPTLLTLHMFTWCRFSTGFLTSPVLEP
jgi:hypothetical protein